MFRLDESGQNQPLVSLLTGKIGKPVSIAGARYPVPLHLATALEPTCSIRTVVPWKPLKTSCSIPLRLGGRRSASSGYASARSGQDAVSGTLCMRCHIIPVRHGQGSAVNLSGCAGRDGFTQRQFCSARPNCVHFFGFHSRASRCASAIWVRVIAMDTVTLFFSACLSPRAAARLNHLCASTKSCSTP